jgi:hypothetical protein
MPVFIGFQPLLCPRKTAENRENTGEKAAKTAYRANITPRPPDKSADSGREMSGYPAQNHLQLDTVSS